MRQRLLFAALSAVSILAVLGSASPAVAGRYCLQGRDWGYPGNCQFSSYGQCMASASGTNSYCGINPRYAYARQQRGRHWGRGY